MAIKLFYFPGNASLAPHILLEEIGQPYELELIDRDKNAHKSDAYLRLNPAGLIPALVDGDVVVPETAAIMLHIADKYLGANFIPPLQSAERAQCYRWLVYLTNTVQADLIHYFYPDRIGGIHAELVKENATARIMSMLDILEAQMAASAGPFLLGKHYTVADIFLFMMCRWTRAMPNPARNRPHLAAFLSMMVARPAVERVLVREALPKPWY